jgi:Ca-activated chloride channel family protein
MKVESFRGVLLLVIFLALAAAACSLGGDDDGIPNDAEVVTVTANTSLGSWLTSAVQIYNEAEHETADGDPIYIQLSLADSGQAVSDISSGESAPSIWIPDDEVWTDVLTDQGNGNYGDNCQSLATSPLVIAMWRPVAESLGWPGLPLGWLDVGSLAADPSAWSYYSGGEYGDSLRLGHTHPGLSGSGTSTLLAIVQAAQSKTDAVTTEDIQQPIVQASVSAFETAVSTFSTSTADLSKTMAERGVQYLGAGIMYESDVVSNVNAKIVPIYPLEGTFVATHPACMNADLEGAASDAAQDFRDYLLSEEAQQSAVANGLRPVNGQVEVGSPLDEAHGVDLSQPEIVFSPPNVDSLYAAQDLWQSARKDVNLVMLLDVSGSMDGSKIKNMRQAAVQFVEQMGDDDLITIIAFSHELQLLAENQQVGPAREKIIASIERLEANGDTALYDAIGEGSLIIGDTTSPNYTNALVVLTDGVDTFSYRYAFDQSLIDMAKANDTTVFSIAYGNDADEEVLSRLALRANGNFFQGDEANIVAIYDEMSAAFGGAVGVGR